MPRVSITIPTFNCARFLGRAIDTALAQTYADYEIIVVDDGSTDDTREVLARFGDKIRYVYQPNGGLSSARNLALSHAGGELIAYLDADDMWYPHRLEAQVAFLDAHQECGFVHSDVTIIDEADRVVHQRFNAETRREVPEGYCTLNLLRRCHVQIPTVLERRGCIERVGDIRRATEDRPGLPALDTNRHGREWPSATSRSRWRCTAAPRAASRAAPGACSMTR